MVIEMIEFMLALISGLFSPEAASLLSKAAERSRVCCDSLSVDLRLSRRLSATNNI